MCRSEFKLQMREQKQNDVVMMCCYVDGPLVCAPEEACLYLCKKFFFFLNSAEENKIIGKLNCVMFISVTLSVGGSLLNVSLIQNTMRLRALW